MSKTDYLGLETTPVTTGGKTFLTYRSELSGSHSSNMTLIDQGVKAVADALNAEKANTVERFGTVIGEINTIKANMAAPFTRKGSVADMTALNAITGQVQNDTYYVVSETCSYSWNGAQWYQSSLKESDYSDRLAEVSEAVQVTYALGPSSFVYGTVTTSGPSSTTTTPKPRARTDFIYLKKGSTFQALDGWYCAAWRFSTNAPDASPVRSFNWSNSVRTADEDGWWIIGLSSAYAVEDCEDLTGKLEILYTKFGGTLYRGETVGDLIGSTLSLLYQGGNLISGLTVTDGRYITAAGADVAPGGSVVCQCFLDYIPVKGGDVYSWSGANGLLISTYDQNMAHIQRHLSPYAKASPGSMRFASNVAYVRLSCYNGKFPDKFMFINGVLPSEYEETHDLIRPEYLPATQSAGDDFSDQMFYSFDPIGGSSLYADGTTAHSGTAEAFYLFLPIGGGKHIRVTYMHDVDLRTAAMENVVRDGQTVKVDSYRDKDIWRLHQGMVGQVVRVAGQYAFQAETELIRNGAWETAIYYEHDVDESEKQGDGQDSESSDEESSEVKMVTDRAVGTFHGYERLSAVSLAVDAIPFSDLTETVSMRKCDLFTAHTVSEIHIRDHEDQKLADAIRDIRITGDTVKVTQKLTWAKSGTAQGSIRAYLAMGCARRRSGDYDLDTDSDTGVQITDLVACDGPVPIYPEAKRTAYTYKNADGEDVTIYRWTPDGDPVGMSLGQVFDVSRTYHRTAISGNSDKSGISNIRRARLWGVESGLSVEISVDFDNKFYVSCNPAFNKLYFRRGDDETVAENDVWNATTVFRFAAG